MTAATLGPIEEQVLRCVRRHHDWVGVSLVARECRLPRRKVLHHLSRHAALGTLEVAHLHELIAALPVGTAMRIPDAPADEPLFRFRSTNVSHPRPMLNVEHVERPLADQAQRADRPSDKAMPD